MDNHQEVLTSIDDVKNKLNDLIDQQRMINENIENNLNFSNQNKIQVICEDYLDKLKTIDSKQLKINDLLKEKKVRVQSNEEVVKILDKAANTLISLEEFCKNKRERNLEKSMITDIMVCYWNAVGIKLQFGTENKRTTLILTNHDQENESLKECRIQLEISDKYFGIIDVEPKEHLEKMKQIESEVKSNGKGLSNLILKLYDQFVNIN